MSRNTATRPYGSVRGGDTNSTPADVIRAYAAPKSSTRRKKATRPATGNCRWVNKPNANLEGGVLEINGTPYELLPLYDGETRVGYRLLKADGTMYDLPADLSQALLANPTALDAWQDITPLDRNEFICWV